MFVKDFDAAGIPPTPVVAVGAEASRAGTEAQSKENPGVMYINIAVRCSDSGRQGPGSRDAAWQAVRLAANVMDDRDTAYCISLSPRPGHMCSLLGSHIDRGCVCS